MPMTGMKFYSKDVVVPPGKEVTLDLAVEPGSATVTVTPVAKGGKVGVASATLVNGFVTAKTANELAVRSAASGAGNMLWNIIRGGEATKFTEVAAGSYSACVVPFPIEVQGMAAMTYMGRHSDSLPAFCAKATVGQSDISVNVTVEIPALEPDDPASGSGKPPKP
jgi:hypothetical protein